MMGATDVMTTPDLELDHLVALLESAGGELRVHRHPSDAVSPPAAVVMLPRYVPDAMDSRRLAGTGGVWEHAITVTVGRYDATRTAAALLGHLVDVLAVLEADPAVHVLGADGTDVTTSTGEAPAYLIRTRLYL